MYSNEGIYTAKDEYEHTVTTLQWLGNYFLKENKYLNMHTNNVLTGKLHYYILYIANFLR